MGFVLWFVFKSLSCLYFFVGQVAREEMMRSKLPNSVLRRIWNLSDIDEDGMLDRDEFAVAMFLIDHKLSGNDIPDVLPERLVPPSKVQRYNLGPREEDRRGPYGEREPHSHDFSGGNSHEAGYGRDPGYRRDASYRGGGGGGGGEGGYHGGGRDGGYQDDMSYGGRQPSSHGRHTDDYDEDSTHLSSLIDRGQ